MIFFSNYSKTNRKGVYSIECIVVLGPLTGPGPGS